MCDVRDWLGDGRVSCDGLMIEKLSIHVGALFQSVGGSNTAEAIIYS